MILNINEYSFDSNNIIDITIRESSKRIFITTIDNKFYDISYTYEKDIQDIKTWQKFQHISYADLKDALKIITLVCDYYINSYTQ